MTRVTQGNNGITKKYSATHRGIDIGWKGGINDNILAHSEGKVVWVQKGQKHNTKAKGNASYGNAIKIKHNNGYYTLYAHLESVDVKLNQNVSQGQKIGYMGNTGNSYGKHLHFEVRNTKDVRINPTPYLNADLPNNKPVTKKYSYKTYDNVKNSWLPKVKTGTNDFAGNIGHGVSGFQIENYTYRVHDKVKKKWLPYVTGTYDFAGNLPNDIDQLQIINATYRVHLKGGSWTSWKSNGESAGTIGKSIDAIQVK